jgi:hypothetical protein
MSRHAHEFNCTNCNWFNYPMLNDAMSGNYTVICGNCGHEHYRYIKKGVVTEDRHNHLEEHGDTIHVMPSACSKEKRKMGGVAMLRQMEAAGLHT